MASTSVFLNCQDIEKSLAFYKALGWKMTHATKDEETGETYYADLDLDGAEVGLGNIGSNDEASFRQWVSTPLGAGVVVYVTVERIAPLWTKAQKSGATVEAPLTDRPYGKVFTLNDPDGYTLTFIQEPRAKPTKRAAKAVRKVAKKVTRKSRAPKSAAGKSLAASRKQAIRKGATTRKQARRGGELGKR